MRVLSIDASTKSGWAVFEDGKYIKSGALPQVKVLDFNVNNDPNLSPHYPHNIMAAAEEIGQQLLNLWHEVKPNVTVLENSVKGRNRHTQRLIEWFHFTIVRNWKTLGPLVYLDPSEWRKLIELRLTKEDKKNNRDVSQGKKRGKINRKHLSVRLVNERFGNVLDKPLKVKDNDRADAINLNLAYNIKNSIIPQ